MVDCGCANQLQPHERVADVCPEVGVDRGSKETDRPSLESVYAADADPETGDFVTTFYTDLGGES